MIQLLGEVLESDPELDHAGPHRTVALVYLRAPGWPTGPGDVDLGLEHARTAVALAPAYPPNQLCLGEALRRTDEREASREAYRRAEELALEWAETGDPDATDWLDRARRALAGL
jgi:hypothetical protein